MHNRLAPKQNRFHYNVFMWCIDLDEIPSLGKRLWLMSLEKFNMFSLRKSDFMELSPGHISYNAGIKEKLNAYLAENNIQLGNGKAYLLTNLRTLGHIFNPVSFYYCYSESGETLCTIVEITNTFHEVKRFILAKNNLQEDNSYHLNTTKYFYVSPFVDLDTNFDFRIHIPEEKLNIRIDDFDKEGKRFFISTLTGKRETLSNWKVLFYSLRFPFITIKVITLIHWQALILWMKKVPWHQKSAKLELQRDLLKPYQN